MENKLIKTHDLPEGNLPINLPFCEIPMNLYYLLTGFNIFYQNVKNKILLMKYPKDSYEEEALAVDWMATYFLDEHLKICENVINKIICALKDCFSSDENKFSSFKDIEFSDITFFESYYDELQKTYIFALESIKKLKEGNCGKQKFIIEKIKEERLKIQSEATEK